jgi:hypothetical protein
MVSATQRQTSADGTPRVPATTEHWHGQCHPDCGRTIKQLSMTIVTVQRWDLNGYPRIPALPCSLAGMANPGDSPQTTRSGCLA